MTADEFFTVAEVCAALNVNRTRVRQLSCEKGGPLKVVRVGRRVLITKSSVYRRIATMDTPPGVGRAIYKALLMRDLTARALEKSPRMWPMRAATLIAISSEMFGTPATAPYRLKIHDAALEVIAAGKRRDWAELERADRELAELRCEHEAASQPPPREVRRVLS